MKNIIYNIPIMRYNIKKDNLKFEQKLLFINQIGILFAL